MDTEKYTETGRGKVITAQEFVKGYCERSGISKDEFYESQVPMPDPTSPLGWAAVSNNHLSIKAHVNINLAAPIVEADGMGEAVAWAMRSGLERCARNPKASHAVYGHSGEDGWNVPLFASQPAPVSARITLQQVLKAYQYADSHPHKYLRGTTNWCAAVAHELNACLDKVKELNG